MNLTPPPAVIHSIVYHGFSVDGEIELDIRYVQNRRISKEKIRQAVVKAVNERDKEDLPWLRDIRLTSKNTRIQLLGTWLKAYVKVRG